MAQTTYTSKYKTYRGNKNVVRIFGKHAFTTADLSTSISAQINQFLYGKLTAIKATLASTLVKDEIFWGTASISTEKKIQVERGTASGTSGLQFFYEVIGR